MDKLSKEDIHKIVVEGSKIYESIKSTYEPKQIGNYLAIEIQSKDAFLGKTSAEALVNAKKIHPNSVFYVVKIGFDTLETIASSLTQNY